MTTNLPTLILCNLTYHGFYYGVVQLQHLILQAQGIVPEDEWDEFMTSLKATLPSTFRITGHGAHAKEMLRIVKSDHISNLVEVVEGEEVIAAPKVLPWFVSAN